jgi:hypothetical protein
VPGDGAPDWRAAFGVLLDVLEIDEVVESASTRGGPRVDEVVRGQFDPLESRESGLRLTLEGDAAEAADLADRLLFARS